MDNTCPSQIKARISEMIIYKQLEQVSKSLSTKDTHLPPMGASQWTEGKYSENDHALLLPLINKPLRTLYAHLITRLEIACLIWNNIKKYSKNYYKANPS